MKQHFLSIALVAVTSFVTGCAMCGSPYDCHYGAYGGSRPRGDMIHGRVASAFDDAEAVNMGVPGMPNEVYSDAPAVPAEDGSDYWSDGDRSDGDPRSILNNEGVEAIPNANDGDVPRAPYDMRAPNADDSNDEFVPEGLMGDDDSLMRDDFIIPEVENFEGPGTSGELKPLPMDLDAPSSPSPTPAIRDVDGQSQGSASTRLREILQDVGQPQQPRAGGADEPQPWQLDISDLGE